MLLFCEVEVYKMIKLDFKSREVIILSLLCIGIMLFIIGNIYFISKTLYSDKVSSVNNNLVEFNSKAIICGEGNNRHIRSFVKEISPTQDLVGIKFILKDSNGKIYSYINNDSSILPDSTGGTKRIDIDYLSAGINPSSDITSLDVFLLIKDSDGKQVFIKNSQIIDVCYSSCDECSLSCDFICTNSP
ncbi:Uncharacterised protein [uncultured archaeon]|nr:Uncharacterised protein [uncultured archaeon]